MIVCLEEDLFIRNSKWIWQECHVSVDSKSDEKLHPSSGLKTSVLVVSPLEYIRKQIENIKNDCGVTSATLGESVEVNR